MVACPNNKPSSGLDWDKRPYKTEVPEPVGCWKADTIKVYVDYDTCYGTGSSDPLVLGWALPLAAQYTRETLMPEMSTYSGAHGLNIQLIDNPDTANVVIRFYSQPWDTKTPSTLADYNPENFVVNDQFDTYSKVTSAVPGIGTKYNGLVNASVSNHVMKHGECWMNLYLLIQIRKDYEAQHRNDWLEPLKGCYGKVVRHERGHWNFCLDDDFIGNTSGLMVRNNMSNHFNSMEESNIDWMYK